MLPPDVRGVAKICFFLRTDSPRRELSPHRVPPRGAEVACPFSFGNGSVAFIGLFFSLFCMHNAGKGPRAVRSVAGRYRRRLRHGRASAMSAWQSFTAAQPWGRRCSVEAKPKIRKSMT